MANPYSSRLCVFCCTNCRPDVTKTTNIFRAEPNIIFLGKRLADRQLICKARTSFYLALYLQLFRHRKSYILKSCIIQQQLMQCITALQAPLLQNIPTSNCDKLTFRETQKTGREISNVLSYFHERNRYINGPANDQIMTHNVMS